MMMSRRGDFSIAMEPFESSAYRSEERIVERYPCAGPQFNYQKVLQFLLKKAENGPLFIKDHAYYIVHIADDTFLSYFQHTFLIRHPRQALPSYFHKWPDVTLKETGYKELAELFDMVVQKYGDTPPVVDADELVDNPEVIVRAYCAQVGIAFIPEALTWPPINRKLGSWHDHLVTTTGFEKSPLRPYLEISANERLMRLYDACIPYYEKLHKYRLGQSV
jgi:hypothetical protein